jgi:RNA polymerase sigma-70 factor (ECF subfamily)
MSDPDETRLLCQAQAGDMEAFADLQARLDPALKRFVRRLTGDIGLEDDLLQDVWLAFYLNLAKIDPPTLRAYLFRMARNRAYDEFRRWGRREEYALFSLDEDEHPLWLSFTSQDPGQKPDELVHWMLLYLEVQEAIDSLPETQREALILCLEGNLSYAEIAQITHSPLGTVKSRLFHAKQALRRRLRPETIQAIEESLL